MAAREPGQVTSLALHLLGWAAAGVRGTRRGHTQNYAWCPPVSRVLNLQSGAHAPGPESCCLPGSPLSAQHLRQRQAQSGHCLTDKGRRTRETHLPTALRARGLSQACARRGKTCSHLCFPGQSLLYRLPCVVGCKVHWGRGQALQVTKPGGITLSGVRRLSRLLRTNNQDFQTSRSSNPTPHGTEGRVNAGCVPTVTVARCTGAKGGST